MAQQKYLDLTGLGYVINKIDDIKANINNPTFTGIPTAPTPDTADDSTQIATTAFVQATVNAIGDKKIIAVNETPTDDTKLSITTTSADSVNLVEYDETTKMLSIFGAYDTELKVKVGDEFIPIKLAATIANGSVDGAILASDADIGNIFNVI